MCRFVESIQLKDGEFIRLELHQERMKCAMEEFFPGIPLINLKESLSLKAYPTEGLYKCRVVYDSIIRQIEFIPYIKREIHSLRLVETEMESHPYKKEDRSELNAAFARRNGCDEVILVKNGFLTDSSFTNIAFYDGLTWWTPRVPLVHGVNRAQLITQGILVEKDIVLSDLVNYQRVSLFNAMNEFGSIELDISSICP